MPNDKPRLTSQILSLKYLNHVVKYWTKDPSKEKGSIEVKGKVQKVELLFYSPILKKQVEPYGELTIIGEEDQKVHMRKHTEVVLDTDVKEEKQVNVNQSVVSTPQQARDTGNRFRGVKNNSH